MKTIKLTLLFCLVSVLSFASVTVKEKEALISLYNATQGNNWTTTWDLTSPISTWSGVTLKDDKVVALDLSFNNLTGTLPNELGDLVNLESLNLFRNNISGNIPSSIGKLNNLKHLNISFNSLEGELPNSIGNLSSLVSLELFMNRIEGELPRCTREFI